MRKPMIPLRTIAVVTTVSATVLAAPAPAHAEMINHGALEVLFNEPVTTSATGQPQRASDVPANMIIITAEDIRRSGARDVPGVLRHAAGVDILQWTDDDTDVSVRGYNKPYSSRLLVLVDGRQVYADFYGYTPWVDLPVQLDEIRQIEVVKGLVTAMKMRKMPVFVALRPPFRNPLGKSLILVDSIFGKSLQHGFPLRNTVLLDIEGPAGGDQAL